MNDAFTPTSTADLFDGDNVHDAASSMPGDNLRDGGSIPKPPGYLRMSRTHDFVENLMINLDTLIYMELCIVYYMDCSFFRLIIRVIAQAIFLTPKPDFIPPFPRHRPYIGAIVGLNSLCLLLHLFTAKSEASEVMRGYLHGGIIIDLIGYKGPTSKFRLALLDIMIAALQCFMLAVHVEKERLKAVLKSADGQSNYDVVNSSQDLDAEERGTRRSITVNTEGAIELQAMDREDTLSLSSESQANERTHARVGLLAGSGPLQDEDEEENPLDIFYSGTVIIAEFRVISTLRDQWENYADATASALQTIGYSAQYAATTSNRQIGAASQSIQSGVGRLIA